MVQAGVIPSVTTYEDRPGSWGVYMFFGIVLVVVGILALFSVAFTSYFTTLLLGWLFLIGGIIEFFSIFFARENRLAAAALGILYAIIGIVIISNPGITLATLTLVLAIAWTVGGLVRVVSAMFSIEDGRGWQIAGGIVTFLLGILVWIGWPESSLYLVGLFIGFDLLIAGLAMTGLSLQLRKAHH